MILITGCSHGRVAIEADAHSVRLGPDVVQGAVIFEPGTKVGAVVPEISAPHLRAIWVAEKVEGTRLIEAHREWQMEGEAQILGIPKETKKPPAKASGGSHEN
jgi:hypothetical protein